MFSKIKRVIYNDPATIILWNDGTKTVAKCSDEDFDREKGFAIAVAKKYFGKNFRAEFNNATALPEAPIPKVKYQESHFTNDPDTNTLIVPWDKAVPMTYEELTHAVGKKVFAVYVDNKTGVPTEDADLAEPMWYQVRQIPNGVQIVDANDGWIDFESENFSGNCGHAGGNYGGHWAVFPYRVTHPNIAYYNELKDGFSRISYNEAIPLTSEFLLSLDVGNQVRVVSIDENGTPDNAYHDEWCAKTPDDDNLWTVLDDHHCFDGYHLTRKANAPGYYKAYPYNIYGRQH